MTNINGKTSGDVTGTSDTVIELFFNKIKNEYKEKYWIEEPDATVDYVEVTIDNQKKKFVLSDENTVKNVDLDVKVTITDKQDEYKNYELVQVEIPNYPSSSKSINIDGSTTLHQLYGLKPTYTVKYYVETTGDIQDSVQVGDKYYELKETMINSVSTGTEVEYSSKTDGTAGVIEGTTENANTYKSYTGYTFNDTVTNINGKTSGDVTGTSDTVIELFFDKIKNEYKEMYWIEDPNATEDYVEVTIDNQKKKFVLSDENTVTNVDMDESVTVTDKQDDYKNYELIQVEISNYPSSSESINSDGSTTLHQLYVLKPTYEVQYYVEVDESEKTNDSLEIDGKYYNKKTTETVTKYASAQTSVVSIKNNNGAGVKEGNQEISDTFKTFEDYNYTQTVTDLAGNSTGIVVSDNSLIIKLFFDKVVIQEEETTQPETTQPETTQPETTQPETTQPETTQPETTTQEETNTEKKTENETTLKKDTQPAKTGDSINTLILLLLTMSGITVFFVVIAKRKNNE